MKRFLALGTLLLALGAGARADQFDVTINAGDIGQNLSNGQYAGTFTATDENTNQTFISFCADTKDEVGFGLTPYPGTLVTGGMPNAVYQNYPSTTGVNIWSGSPYSDVGNRLNYLLTQLLGPSLGTLTNAEASALQAGIWQAEGNYVVANQITGTLVTDVVDVLTGNTFSGPSGWAALDALNSSSGVYNASTNYASSNEILIVPASTGNSSPNYLDYQILVGIVPVPEPSSMAIAGLGAMGMIAYGWKRRKRS